MAARTSETALRSGIVRMSEAIQKSVGRNGKNQRNDVKLVQRLLIKYGYKIGSPDGICGPRTQFAIETLQHTFLKVPDGRIDPGGRSWKALSAETPGIVSAPRLTGSQLTKLLPKPKHGAVNIGLQAVNNAYMLKVLGNPREDYSEDCQPVTDAKLKRNITVASVGPFKVQGLSLAISSLALVMGDVRREWPAVYAALGTAGMLCCRYQRNSKTQISNHSWGTAVDLTINGILDQRGDNMVQTGLSLIAPTFNKHGWCWGATFATEDAMHFEAGKALIESWAGSMK
jgi:peptidoglycan hydrolase-like protein with peptidoglycan-binding domain